MDVAIIASARFPIAEPFAAGMEMHTHVLANSLAARGHQVTVYAAGGAGNFAVERMLPVDFEASATARRDLAAPPRTLLSEHHSYLDAMLRIAVAGHDLVHVNAVHYLPFATSSLIPAPVVATLHTPPTPWLESALVLARRRPRPPFVVSVSEANAAAWGPGVAHDVIHNGVDLTRWVQRAGGGGAVWTGRIVPEKAPHLAIDAARRAGLPIELLGPVHDEPYFADEVMPRLGSDARYLGHATVAGMAEVVGRAAVAVITPAWDEPFGLVVAEALACGTPVAAFRRGALPELVDVHVGRLANCDDVGALAVAIDEARRLDRSVCRRRAEQCYADDVMAARYEACFETVLDRWAP